ncbi:MAG TPA: hypothetical protein VFE78_30150 [Gemmataceae bacterium]|nr:hypothetical protein [Gemmataceae bacterium]
MRALRTLLFVVVLMVLLSLGCSVLYAALALKAVTEKAQATPQRLPALELAEQGVPDNLHVEVTDFTFGEPVVEQNERGWAGAWLPVVPAPRPKKAPKYAIFYYANVRDRAALDEFLERQPAEALVTTGLPPTSSWRVGVGPALRKAYPKLNFAQALVLAEPRLSAFGHSVALSDPRLHDPRYESGAAWGGAGLVLLALVGLYFLMKGDRDEGYGGLDASGLDADALRARLASERPESTHSARAWGVLQGVIGYGLLTGVMVLAVVLLAGATVASQHEGRPLGAVIFVFLALPACLGAWAAGRVFLRMLRWPTDVAVCPTGLRWREGRKRRAILWAEVAEVRRDVKVVQRYAYPGGLVGAINQMNNPSPPRYKDTLRIILRSGATYVMAPQMVTDYLKLAETAPRLWKEAGLNRDAAGVTAAWLRALPGRARASEAR